MPTNEWWQNVVLDEGTNLLATLPYILQVLDNGLHVSMPMVKEARKDFVNYPFWSQLKLGATSLPSTHSVAAHDQLSVTMQWAHGGQSMRTPLVRGMPYVTAFYDGGLIPKISLETSAITALNGAANVVGTFTGARFKLKLNSGQTWIVYFEYAVEVSVTQNTLSCVSPFTGYMRAAALPSDAIGDTAAAATAATAAAAVLDAHATRVVVGGDVNAVANANVASLAFEFRTEGSGELLTMALPHHMETIQTPQTASLSYNTMKGDMTAIIGDTWEMREPLTTIEWNAPRDVAPEKIEDIRDAVKMDMIKGLWAADPYGSGKEIASLAQLALIADHVNMPSHAEQIRARVKGELEKWFQGHNSNPLRFEPTYGGLVSTNSWSNKHADFGNAWYNDHYFHYGYFIFSAAVVGRKDLAWLQKWKEPVLHLVRDIANPSATDSQYTQFRHKDWFCGHSWASGLFQFFSGRNQESTSEAVNAWYGIYLFGLALQDDRMRDLGRLLLATEIRSSWRYWQIDDANDIYPSPFHENKVATIVWSTKADRSTWFGSNVEYTFGIQMLPFTPMSEELLRPVWIKDSMHVWWEAAQSAAEQWRAFLLMSYALIEPEDAWNRVNVLKLYDNGNTRANTLYWIATRMPPLDSHVDETMPDGGVTPAAVQQGSSTGTYTSSPFSSVPSPPPSAEESKKSIFLYALLAAGFGLCLALGIIAAVKLGSKRTRSTKGKRRRHAVTFEDASRHTSVELTLDENSRPDPPLDEPSTNGDFSRLSAVSAVSAASGITVSAPSSNNNSPQPSSKNSPNSETPLNRVAVRSSPLVTSR